MSRDQTRATPGADTLFINARFLEQPLTGVQRYARETLQALDRCLPASPLGSLRCVALRPPGAQ